MFIIFFCLSEGFLCCCCCLEMEVFFVAHWQKYWKKNDNEWKISWFFMLHIISHPFIHAVPKSPLSHSKWMALPDKIQRKISPVMDSPRHKVHFRFIFLIIKFQMANRTAQFLFPRFPGKGIERNKAKWRTRCPVWTFCSVWIGRRRLSCSLEQIKTMSNAVIIKI